MLKSLLVVIIFSLGLLNSPLEAARGEIISLSVPYVKLERAERIMGFSLTVYQGVVTSLPDIPSGWEIQIKNSGNPTVSAGAIQGANAFVDGKFFENFIFIEKIAQPIEPFDIEVTIHTTKDFESFRSTTFKMKDLKLRKVKGSRKGDRIEWR